MNGGQEGASISCTIGWANVVPQANAVEKVVIDLDVLEYTETLLGNIK